jgi:hypothetical protein
MLRKVRDERIKKIDGMRIATLFKCCKNISISFAGPLNVKGQTISFLEFLSSGPLISAKLK